MKNRNFYFLFLFFSISTGIASSSPTCRTWVASMPAKVHHSAATLAAWAKYAIAHPEKQKKIDARAAAARRSAKSRSETLAMLEMACEEAKPIVPTLEALVPQEPSIEVPLFVAELNPNPVPTGAVPAQETATCDCGAAGGWYGGLFGAPILFAGGGSSPTPSPEAPVPEPSSIVLTLAGIGILLYGGRRG